MAKKEPYWEIRTDYRYNESLHRFEQKWPEPTWDLWFGVIPWERRVSPSPGENCKDEVRHLIKRWGAKKVRNDLEDVTRGREGDQTAARRVWFAIEALRRYFGIKISPAGTLLSDLLKKGEIWGLNSVSNNWQTLRRLHAKAASDGMRMTPHIEWIIDNQPRPLEEASMTEDENLRWMVGSVLMDFEC